MAKIELLTSIHAPIERCFLLSLSVDLTLSTAHTGEKAVSGVTSGIMKPGDVVTWRARHLGFWQELTSRITEYTYPAYFCDEMLQGAFRSICHEHHFSTKGAGTLMQDIFLFETPLGIFGKLANSIFLKSYMENLLLQRNKVIQSVAQTEEWRKFLPH